MKIAGLISRFENRGGTDPKLSVDQRASLNQGENDQEDSSRDFTDKVKASPRTSSPGRLQIRRAIQNLRSPKSPGISRILELDQNDSEQVRVDNILESNSSQQTTVTSVDETKESNGDLLDRVDASNEETNIREFLITEHSNRTLVTDNKQKKSQSSKLPDTPWSSRNLGGTSKQIYEDSRIEVSGTEVEKSEGSRKMQYYEAEYGTLALRDEDPLSTKECYVEDDCSLPPEVVAMSAVSDSKNTKTKAKSSPSLLKSYNIGDVSKKKESAGKFRNNSSRQVTTGNGNSDHQPHSRRRPSTGLLKRLGSNEKTESSSSKQLEISVKPREIDNSEAIKPPTRSLSAGNLAIAKLKAKSFRERKARSQSPGDEQSTDRKPRPGQKKSVRNLMGKSKEGDSFAIRKDSNENTNPLESPSQPRPPRRIRGRSPGNLVERQDSTSTEQDENSEDDSSKRPILIRLESRGRSPGTIQRSINMSGEVRRSQSPGSLNREGQSQSGGRSPAAMKRLSYSSRTKSPGRLTSLRKSSGYNNENSSQSPSASRTAADRKVQGSFRKNGHSFSARCATESSKEQSNSPTTKTEICFDPQPTSTGAIDIKIPPSSPCKPKSSSRLGEREIVLAGRAQSPERTTIYEIESPKGESMSAKNLSVPRAKSPGALARRPAKNPRATQTKKAQSLFEKTSPSSAHLSPKPRISKDDNLLIKSGDQPSSFSSFQ
ncbi:hypothetical protein IV203_009345 [Nitzschia inconspicua]|uniref:Uncharacterized protein n=1 Tax=Nitzschia inconspicua TaxID=303405 RepID=A0A9K3L232_9STRA|nr:hypothetical protein IV203_009345 [Nitzschia inconspicua]